MITIVSTIGTVPYGTSKYLVEIIQPTLNKNKHRVINLYIFVQEAKSSEIYKDDLQVSYDVENLYPLVPVEKAINVLIDTLNNGKEQLKERTKSTLTDVHKLTEFFLSKCYFLQKNNFRFLQKIGPIELSFMVVLS